MSTITCVFLILSVFHGIRADTIVSEYVTQSKEDISAWHIYFPSRHLEQERLTNLKAMEITETLVNDISSSLAATIRYQARELERAQMMFEGTDAQGCLANISSVLEEAVDEGVSYFKDAVVDVPSQFQRLANSLTKTNASYYAAYQSALVGIDNCARAYPNSNFWSRLKTCVDNSAKNYYTMSNTTMKKLYWGSSLDGTVMYNVVTHAQQAAVMVQNRGREFLDKLALCANLSDFLDYDTYVEDLFSGLSNTTSDLTSQILIPNSEKIKEIEQQIMMYYNIQKRALEKSRNQWYYYWQMVTRFSKYQDTFASISEDYPGNPNCLSEAKNALRDAYNTGVTKAFECDNNIEKNTKYLTDRINGNLVKINNILSYTGNVAILSCFSDGYVFAEDTISKCYSLTWTSFKINITDMNATIARDVEVLQGSGINNFNNSSQPCGNFTVNRGLLEAERVMYNLRRCLYISTETNIPYTDSPTSTTPASITTPTTTNPFTTTITTPSATTPITTTTPTAITTNSSK